MSPLNRSFLVCGVLAAALCAGACGSAKRLQKHPPPLRSIVPADRAVTGYAQTGSPTIAMAYTDLTQIFGGDAVAYLDADFVSGIIQNYHDTRGPGRVQVRIFRMGSKPAALAFFRNTKKPGARDVLVGDKYPAFAYTNSQSHSVRFNRADAPGRTRPQRAGSVIEFAVEDVYAVVLHDRNTPGADRVVRTFAEQVAHAAQW